MDSIAKINSFKTFLLTQFSEYINEFEFDDERVRLNVYFIGNQRLFIRFNDYQQYAYQFILSPKIGKFFRFDNFDDHWDVSKKPHHFHSIEGNVVKSPMNGEPIPKEIRSNLRNNSLLAMMIIFHSIVCFLLTFQ